MTDHDQDIDAPLIPPHVLDYLERIFPDSLPVHMDITDRALWAAVGAQNVIRHIRQLVDEQTQREME